MRSKSTSTEGRFAYEGLDRVIHERARLSVLTSLMTNPKGLSFNDLKQLCALTDGNLSRHLSVLEEAKMVEIIRGHDRNRPQTICRITASGRKRYLEYLETLEQVVRDAAGVNKSESGVTKLLEGLNPSRRLKFFVHLLCDAKLYRRRQYVNDIPMFQSQPQTRIKSRSMGLKLFIVCALALADDDSCVFCG